MANLSEFLVEYRKDCAKNIEKVVDRMIEEGYHDISQVHDILVEYKTLRDSFPRGSLDFQMYWSVITYIQDVIDCFYRQEKGATPA